MYVVVQTYTEAFSENLFTASKGRVPYGVDEVNKLIFFSAALENLLFFLLLKLSFIVKIIFFYILHQ